MSDIDATVTSANVMSTKLDKSPDDLIREDKGSRKQGGRQDKQQQSKKSGSGSSGKKQDSNGRSGGV